MPRCHIVCLALLCTIGLAHLLPATAAAGVRGRAYGIYADLPGEGITPTTWCDTGWLPNSPLNPLVVDVGLLSRGPALRAEAMQSGSARDHDGCHGRSHHEMGAGWILLGGAAEVTWSSIATSEEDTCCTPEDDDYRPASIGNLTFGGQSVQVSGLPNQIVEIPEVGLLTINELRHTDDNDCDDDDNEHHALHLVLGGGSGGEVIVGSTRYDDDDDCCAVKSRRSTWGTVKTIHR